MGCGSSDFGSASLRSVPFCGLKHKLFIENIIKYVCTWCGEKYELDQVNIDAKNCYMCENCDIHVCEICYETALFKLQFQDIQKNTLKCFEKHRLRIFKLSDKGPKKSDRSFPCNGCIKFDLTGYCLQCISCEYRICMKCVHKKEAKNPDIVNEIKIIQKDYEEYKKTYKTFTKKRRKGQKAEDGDEVEEKEDEDGNKDGDKNLEGENGNGAGVGENGGKEGEKGNMNKDGESNNQGENGNKEGNNNKDEEDKEEQINNHKKKKKKTK